MINISKCDCLADLKLRILSTDLALGSDLDDALAPTVEHLIIAGSTGEYQAQTTEERLEMMTCCKPTGDAV